MMKKSSGWRQFYIYKKSECMSDDVHSLFLSRNPPAPFVLVNFVEFLVDFAMMIERVIFIW